MDKSIVLTEALSIPEKINYFVSGRNAILEIIKLEKIKA